MQDQIVFDPANARWLKYYPTGKPFFLAGAGDPEDFLYRGSLNPNGTRNGDQWTIVQKLAGTGANGIYFQAIRSQLRETPEGYEAQRRRALAAVKLKQLIYHRAKLTPQELREAYAQDHKGSLKDFEKEKEAFGARVQQQRALDLINYYLRQLSTQVEIRSYLEQRETGT